MFSSIRTKAAAVDPPLARAGSACGRERKSDFPGKFWHTLKFLSRCTSTCPRASHCFATPASPRRGLAISRRLTWLVLSGVATCCHTHMPVCVGCCVSVRRRPARPAPRSSRRAGACAQLPDEIPSALGPSKGTLPAEEPMPGTHIGAQGARRKAAACSPMQPHAAPCSPVQPRAAPCSPVQPRAAPCSPVQPRAVPHLAAHAQAPSPHVRNMLVKTDICRESPLSAPRDHRGCKRLQAHSHTMQAPSVHPQSPPCQNLPAAASACDESMVASLSLSTLCGFCVVFVCWLSRVCAFA